MLLVSCGLCLTFNIWSISAIMCLFLQNNYHRYNIYWSCVVCVQWKCFLEELCQLRHVILSFCLERFPSSAAHWLLNVTASNTLDLVFSMESVLCSVHGDFRCHCHFYQRRCPYVEFIANVSKSKWSMDSGMCTFSTFVLHLIPDTL